MYALNESLAFLLNRTGVAVAVAFTEELRQHGMSLAMWRVIAALWSSGNQTLSGLSEFTSTEVSTLSRQVAALTMQGLIAREKSGINWRSVNLSLTPKGRNLVERLLPAVQRHEHAALDGVGEADIRRLKRLLKQIYENLIKFDEVRSLED